MELLAEFSAQGLARLVWVKGLFRSFFFPGMQFHMLYYG